jgi:hypothetical protein
MLLPSLCDPLIVMKQAIVMVEGHSTAKQCCTLHFVFCILLEGDLTLVGTSPLCHRKLIGLYHLMRMVSDLCEIRWLCCCSFSR